MSFKIPTYKEVKDVRQKTIKTFFESVGEEVVKEIISAYESGKDSIIFCFSDKDLHFLKAFCVLIFKDFIEADKKWKKVLSFKITQGKIIVVFLSNSWMGKQFVR